MSSWARRAADIGSVVTSCGHPGSAATPPYRLEKVKFGVPLDEVCKNNDNIPGPLLVLILKLNKESPNRRDVFRAPGHQGAMKKLIHFLQSGRLVNVDNYSVYTIASVLKKFLRKIPNGIFGRSGEKELFDIIELGSEAEQTERLHRLFTTLPRYTQHLLVLLFGTFRVIASNAAHAGTGMTSEALGVSVAPSFFQSCVSDGKTARMEDVLKFKVATKIMKHIIDKFATHDLFGRDNYEYYARVTGRILKVQDEWICSFQYPPPPRGKLAQQKYALQHSLEAEKTWLQCQCERWGLLAQEESRSTPALLTSSSSALDNSVLSLGVTPEHSFIESCARLSVSLEGPGLFAMTSSPIPKRSAQELQRDADNDDADEEHYADDDDDEDDFAAELEMGNDDDIENNPKNYLLPSRAGGAPGGRRQTRNAATNVAAIGGDAVDAHDDDEDDDDEVTVVKRRYRQNKKKILTQTRMQQHQRRLRAGTKSLDSGERVATAAAAVAASENGSANGSAAVAASNSKAKASTHLAGKATRTCSRCNRGIRHSSSCSSASGGAGGGGAAGNGSGMTMEELRAVNRYAESTKSLSYLPQVHERQTARMRTRSEWFLGPRDSVVALQLPNTCSNCCLAAAQQQQQHYQQHSYLGGGSTRDMRTHRSDFDDDDDDGGGGVYARNYGINLGVERDCDAAASGNALYLYYKKRLQQQKQLQQQQQQRQAQSQFEDPGQVYCLQAEHMDTDESTDYDTQIHSTAAFAGARQPGVLLRATAADAGGKERSRHEAAAAASGRRMFLDTNTVGNIRLSNSAESVQYPVAGSGRRPSARRFIGVNVPRQYPLRSSLRRRERQVGSNNSAGSAGSGNNVADNNHTAVAMLPVGNAPPSVRNSIAECCAHGSQHILTPTFPYNRLEGRATSLEHKQPFRAYIDADDVSDACDGSIVGNMFMDTMEALKAVHATCCSMAAATAGSGSNRLSYTTATISSNISPALSSRNLENLAAPPAPMPLAQPMRQQQQQQQQQQTAKTGPADDGTSTEGVSTITFKAPRV